MDLEKLKENEYNLLELYGERVEKTLQSLSDTEDVNQRQFFQKVLFIHISLFHKHLNHFQTVIPNDEYKSEAMKIYGAMYYLLIIKIILSIENLKMVLKLDLYKSCCSSKHTQ